MLQKFYYFIIIVSEAGRFNNILREDPNLTVYYKSGMLECQERQCKPCLWLIRLEAEVLLYCFYCREQQDIQRRPGRIT